LVLSAQRGRAEIVACETCGNAQRDAEGRVPGETLLAALRAALVQAGEVPVDVSSVRCLWACKRSCAVALRSVGRVGYLLADLEPTDISARALIDYAALYAASEEGAVPYKTWPAAIKGHFLCRFPKAEDPKAAELDTSGAIAADPVPLDLAQPNPER
jgi:predicted metal-binding protein